MDPSSASKLPQDPRLRRVLRVAMVYGLTAWIIIEGASVIPVDVDWGTWRIRFTLGLVIIGFPVALGLGWNWDGLAPGANVREHAENAPALPEENEDPGGNVP